MKKHFYFLFAVCFVSTLDPAAAQKIIHNSSITGITYAGNKTNRIYVPPPGGAFVRRSATKGGASVTLLSSGLPYNANKALQYAASILETVLPSGTKITVSATWEAIATNGVLANSSITGFAAGWAVNAIDPLVAYPVSLAEKIAGENLNDSLDSDIDLHINSSANWYLGTDGNTPAQKYDLVTVVLHEICHGLGFYDSFTTNSTTGWFGLGVYPLIYDTFIESLDGHKLIDTLVYPNHSAALKSQLTGGNVYFNGPLLSKYLSGNRVELYAPPTWDAGSSISHLDENAPSVNDQLMTPFIDMGEAIHNPGKLTMSVLGDLGWINTRIVHKPTHDTEKHLSQLPVSAVIESDTIYDHNKVGLVYSSNGFTSADTILMVEGGTADNYSCVLPVSSYNNKIEYYFYTEDYFNRLYRSPSYIDSIRYTVYIGVDTVKPVIDHTPLVAFLEKVDTINFRATVTDNLGIDTVYVEYTVNEEVPRTIGLKPGKDDLFSAGLNAASLHLAGGDSIRYRIIAADSALTPNQRILPSAGFFTIHIEDLSEVVERYATDFSGSASDDFINDGFTIGKPSGFLHYGLNSLHPYLSPEDNSKSINNTSLLRHPFKFTEAGLIISFNEIVLVEPGEDGAAFGSADFFDYVVLEGSRNFGKSWFYFSDGWDSRLHKSWETAYNNGIGDMNSTTTGNESMLYSHSIRCSPSDKIAAGDTLLIRFRLYSDPFANGWGWNIEDLNIRPFIDAVNDVNNDIAYTIYPNPGKGIIKIHSSENGSGTGKMLKYSVLNASGICIKSDFLPGHTEDQIDISGFPSGIYFIVLTRDDWLTTLRYSLVR